MHKSPHLCLTCALLVLAGAAKAQQPVDAGTLQQQIQRQQVQPLPGVAKPLAPPPRAAETVTGLTVTVTRFEFAGNTLLSDATLAPVVASYLNRPLSYADLQAAAAAIAEAYRQAGWVVRSFLPQQELGAGVVKIQILEAVLGAVNLQARDPESALLVTPDLLRERVLAVQAQGELINMQEVERALLLLDDLAGVAVEGTLAVGQGERETNLVLSVANEARVTGDVRLDNTGSRSTGSSRLGANLALASPTQVGDALGLNVLHTEGSDYARVSYRRPLGLRGWSAEVDASELRYRLVGADFSALNARGSATTAGLRLSYPLLRSRAANASISLGADRKQYDNESAAVTTTQYAIDGFQLVLSGNRSDAWAGGGNVNASLVLSTGDVDLSDSPHAAADALTTQTAGRFNKLRYTVDRQQALSDRWSVIATLSGQFADKNLDSAEKFFLGGSSGVRAYPASEAGGSEGQMVNLELQARLNSSVKVIGFYDWGRVRVNVHNNFTGASPLNDLSLQGVGLALAWTYGKLGELRVTWAHRLGDNPNPTADGRDQDGTLTKSRFWLTASLYL